MQLQDHFSKVGEQLGLGRVTATFRPYSELKHTWSSEDGCVRFRISDYLEGAPDEVLESLAWYLGSRAAREECDPEKSRSYLEYTRSRRLWQPVREIYIHRSRNLDIDPVGEAQDLRQAFAYVNSFYFGGKLGDLQIVWAHESPRRRLGYYFEPLGLLAVNRALDSPEVPRYVLEFVIFHELLHHVDSKDGRPRRRVHHTKQFRQQERRFTHFEEAEGWLRRIAARSAKGR